MPAVLRRPVPWTQRAVIEAARKAARKVRGPLTLKKFVRLAGISNYHIYKLFPEGGWDELLERAGLQASLQRHQRCPDEELLAEYHRVVSELGKIPTWHMFASRSRHSGSLMHRRFGAIGELLRRYEEWLKKKEPASPLLALLCANPRRRLAPPAGQSNGSLQYGAPLQFRGLLHAPVNEQGVICLFGMVCEQLGFAVEGIQQGFPDCEAKRALDSRRERWQRVRIEFEYRSVNFRDHRHDPAGCDLIVCWQHDWPACPVEVLELRKAITKLPAA